MEVQILGDEVSRYRTYIKIPDDWRRPREELTLPRVMVSMVLPFLVLGGLMITAVIIFLKNLRSEDAHAIPWRRIGGWSLWGLAGYLLTFAFGDRLATFMNAYQTAIPFKTMLAGIGIGVILGAVVYFAAIAAAVWHGLVFCAAGVWRGAAAGLERDAGGLLPGRVVDWRGRDGGAGGCEPVGGVGRDVLADSS